MQIDSTTALRASALREIREAKGLTLRAAAQQSSIDPGYLSKVERGQKQLSIESLYRLAVVLELAELAETLKPFLPERRAA